MTETAAFSSHLAQTDDPILAAIRHRRSMGKMTDQVPPRELIQTILEAGTWAPNHHMTEPWRFVVLEGEARNALGAVMGAVDAARYDDPAKKAAAAESAARKPLRAPYVIGVGVEPDPTAPEIEEVCAVAAAAQNMLLAADALGMAAIWRSGWTVCRGKRSTPRSTSTSTSTPTFSCSTILPILGIMTVPATPATRGRSRGG